MTKTPFATCLAGVFLVAAIPSFAVADGTRIHGKAQSDFYSLSGNLRHGPRTVSHASSSSSSSTRSASTDSRGSSDPSGSTGSTGPTGPTLAEQLADLPAWASQFVRNGRLLPTEVATPRKGGIEYCSGGRNPIPCRFVPTPAAPVAAPAVAAPAAPPQVTPGVVLTAVRRIGLPSLQARTQPEGKTLVHFPTIFYTNPRSVTRTVALLGQSVEIRATPDTFTWHYGDGSSASTTTPGARYPAKDVTHEYLDAHITVQTSVDVTYSARFRVGNGAWQTIPGAVTIAGPASPLRISEATAVLSGDY